MLRKPRRLCCTECRPRVIGNKDIQMLCLMLACMLFVFGRLQLEEAGGAAFDGNAEDEQGDEDGEDGDEQGEGDE